MGPLEAELHRRINDEMAEIEGLPELMLQALDEGGVEGVAGKLSAEQAMEMNARMVTFCRQAIFRLAQELDELRAERG
jgi:hypothetical protein